MQIEAITSVDEFRRLRDDWERVYAADPGAHLFLSWTWLYGWLPSLADPWVVLAAREDRNGVDQYVAFWPIRIETQLTETGLLLNHVRMAGNFAADYTGLICLPAAENRAVGAFARYLKTMGWATLQLENLRAPDPRIAQLLAYFSKSKFTITEISRINKDDGIDNCICTRVELPADWESYLARLSANTRQKLRRLLRLPENENGFRISVASAETVQRDIDILLELWRRKWGSRKGGAIDALVRTNRKMLLRSFELGLLYLPVVWQGERPLTALAILVDDVKRSMLFYMAGRDEDFEGPPAGMLAHAHSIRHAIAQGYRCYDFLRGNEAYKYSFGVNEDRIRCLAIRTNTGRNLLSGVDPRTIPNALKLATAAHQRGRLAEAERGYRQILQTDPNNADTLHRLGQLLSTRHDYAEAKRTFTRLTRVLPDAAKPWFCLAQTCEALGHHVEAENAYRNVAAIAPQFPGIDQKLSQNWTSAQRTASLPQAASAIH